MAALSEQFISSYFQKRLPLEVWRQVWRRHRLRSFLSSLGVMCGVASVVAMLTIGEGARRETIRQISRLGLENVIVRAAGNASEERSDWREAGLRMQDRYGIESLEIFVRTTVVKELPWRIAELEDGGGQAILATEPNYAVINGLVMAEGRFLHGLDIQKSSLICVIGADIADSLEIHGQVGRTITLEGEMYTIVGRLAPVEWAPSRTGGIQPRNFNQCVFLPADLGEEEDISEIIARIRDGNNVLAAGKLVERNLQISRKGMKPAQVVVPLALLNQAEESQDLFNIILGSIAAISLLVGGIGIMNIMLASVAERTPEIGLRRAVGATRNDIMIQFVLEAVMIGVAGGSAGLLLGILGSAGVGLIAGWPTAVTGMAVLLPIVMSMAVTGIAGLYPAWLAANVDPIIALRQSTW